jgi:hypothetical protein
MVPWKVAVAVAACIAAIVAGAYGTGYFTYLFLGIDGHPVYWNTGWGYIRSLDHPALAPFLWRIKLGIGVGCMLPGLAWIGVLVVLVRYFPTPHYAVYVWPWRRERPTRHERVREVPSPPPASPPKEEEGMKPVHIAASALVAATVTACASPPSSALRETIAAESAVHDADIDLNLQPVAWPVSFRRHNFSSVCFDTLSCRIFYGGVPTFQDTPSLPSSHYGPNYLDLVRGTYGAIPNFPDPAKIEWVSKDGTHHKAEIDIGSIFRDQRVLHNVPKEEIPDQPDGRIAIDPLIFLEINDRTVRVYMRAFVPTRTLQIPGNVYSDAREDWILAKTYNF